MYDEGGDDFHRRNRADFVQNKTYVDFTDKVLYNRQSMSEIRQEKTDITIAKGLGILLVVIGHILARGRPEGHDWFVEVMNLIYAFHMPFFMVISGYVFFRPGRVEKLYETYTSHLTKQTCRLLIPFFAMGIFVMFGKMATSPFLHVDNKPEGMMTGLYNLFWNTDQSPSFFIWYIFVLYIYAIITPLAFRFLPKALYVCLGAGIVLYVLNPPHVLYLTMLMPYFLFFMAGGLLRTYDDLYLTYLDQYKLLWILLFIASFAFYLAAPFDYKYIQLIIGLCSIPALHAVCRMLMDQQNTLRSGFYYLGQNTLVIYLFNTICIGVVKGILFLFISWDGAAFFFFLPVLIAAGLIGPLVINYLWQQRYLILPRASD